jgi:hypothetical protein
MQGGLLVMTLSTMGWVESHINLQLASSHHQPPPTPPEKDIRTII